MPAHFLLQNVLSEILWKRSRLEVNVFSCCYAVGVRTELVFVDRTGSDLLLRSQSLCVKVREPISHVKCGWKRRLRVVR